MTMKPCLHLDYTAGKFTGCTIQTATPWYPNVRYWLRGPEWTDNGPGERANPAKVQFCAKRGRINGVFDCYNGEMGCYEPAAEQETP